MRNKLRTKSGNGPHFGVRTGHTRKAKTVTHYDESNMNDWSKTFPSINAAKFFMRTGKGA